MSFGGSAGDVLIFIKLCSDIYKFWKNAEQDVADVLKLFETTRLQLIGLEKLLSETGQREYPLAAELKKDLEKHRELFQNLPTLAIDVTGQAPPTSRFAKPRDKFRLSLNADRLERIRANIEGHRRRLHEFKLDIIFEVFLNKLAAVPSQSETVGEETYDYDHLHIDTASERASDAGSVFSRAGTSVAYAAYLNSKNMQTDIADSQQSNYFETPSSSERAERYFKAYVEEIIGEVEAGRLYAVDVPLDQRLEQLTKIGDAFATMRSCLLEGSPASRRSVPPSTFTFTPLTTTMSPHSFQIDLENDMSPSLRRFYYTTPPSSIVPPRTSAVTTELPTERCGGPSAPPDAISLASASANSWQDDRMVGALPPAHTDESLSGLGHGQDFGDSRLQFSVSDSVATGTEERAQMVRPFLAQGRIYVSGLLGNEILRRTLSVQSTDAAFHILCEPLRTIMTPHRLFANEVESRRVYRHILEQGLKDFPEIMISALVSIDAQQTNAPYVVKFSRPQYADVLGEPRSEHWSADLKYHFELPADRDSFRELIFGKTLLADAEVDQVQDNKRTLCEMDYVSLWETPRENVYHGQSLIQITVPLRGKARSHHGHVMALYNVLTHDGLAKDITKARKDGAKLSLEVSTVHAEDEEGPATRQGSVSTSGTGGSYLSRITGRRRSSAAAKPEALFIMFSEDTQILLEEKAIFLDRLEQALLPIQHA